MKVFFPVLTATLLLTPWPAASEEIELEYPKLREVATSRLREVPAGRDVPAQMPEALEIRAGVHRPPPDNDAVDIDRQARRAVSDTLAHAVRDAARGHFEVGFWQGMRRAFDDPYLGEDARAAGFGDGHYDPEAQAQGERLGRDAAEARADELARVEVEAQFRDLSREPRLNPQRPWVEPALEVPRLAAPSLRAVFEMTPYQGSHAVDPWRVYRCASYTDLYRGRWSDPESAFRHWENQQRRGAYWHGLDADEKGRFRVVFRYEYADAMAERAPRLRQAHRRGHREGWRHGARLQEEWSYRQGYREGYGLALSEASSRGFDDTFGPRYDDLYRRLFDDWSTRPVPEILEVWLDDGNGDGVFEPGEEVLASYQIANYGGAGATLPLRYGSAVAAAYPAEHSVELPRRGVIRSRQPLSLRVAGTTPPRTETAAELEIAGATHRAPFRVAYPLELEAPVRLVGHDAVSGRASLAVGVINRSRRRLPATATLRFADGRLAAADKTALELAPGAGHELRFEVYHLEPLALLAGEARFVVETRSRGQLHDELSYRAPALATRLEDPALVDYLLALARRGGSAAEVAKAHRLTLDRLRADWQRAVAAGGNPYRDDRKRGGTTTALGDLVRAFQAERATLAEPRVFGDLVPGIEALASDLPGAHPFLRRYLRKLARQMG